MGIVVFCKILKFIFAFSTHYDLSPSYIIIMKLKLPNWKSLCNPNLLTNSDFKSGIINQKGETTYDFSSQSNGEFTIDMWKITKMKLIVKSTEGTIRIENSDTTSHSISHNHFDKPLINTHTFYANVKNVSEGCYMWFYNRETGATYEQSENLVSGDNVWTWSPSQPGDIIVNFGISIPAGGYIELYQCKLEKGQYFTGMPAWNEADELNKCQYYFERIYLFSDEWSWFSNAYVITRNNKSSFSLFFKQKAKVPSVTLNGLLKILFYETWYDCTKEGAVGVTKNNFRFSFSYPQEANRANGTSCPVALVRQDTEPYIDIDSYNY